MSDRGKGLIVIITEKEARLIKEFPVETTKGSKLLSVYHGDIFEDTGDIIGIAVYNDEKSRGELYSIYEKRKDEYLLERKVLSIYQNYWTAVSSSVDGTHQLLFIHSGNNEGESIAGENLSRLLKITFATLSTIQFEGKEIRQIALPVLFRKGIKEAAYTEFIHHYLYEASQYIRNTHSIQSVKIYLWQEEDAVIWDKVLNNKLVPLNEQEIGNEPIVELKQKIIMKLQSATYQNLPKWVQRNVQQRLAMKNPDLFQLTSVIDQVVNYIVDEIYCALGFAGESTINPFHQIRVMKSQRLIIEWLADYMLSIKTFKRHIHNHPPSKTDMYHYLLLVLQVLTYFEECFIKEGVDLLEQK